MKEKFLYLIPALFIVSALAQESTLNDKINQLSGLGNRNSEYRIGNGDLLEISFFGAQTLNRVCRVNGAGGITLPFLGEVAVDGLTVYELEQKLTEGFRDTRLLKFPQVTVFIKEYRSQPIFVLGAVREPGQYEMTRQLNLIDALAMAGGLDLEKADQYAIVQRNHQIEGQDDGAAESTTTKIDLKKLLQLGELELNLPLKGSDVIHVPERVIEFYYVVGEVNNAGAFELPKERTLLVSQAIANAGGLVKTANSSKGVLVRYDGSGVRQELAVKVNDILRGKVADPAVLPDDIIFIPGSRIKSLGYGLLEAIPNTVEGAIVWGWLR